MPPKKKHGGVLAVDPSWKGMAVAAYVPVHRYEFACCMDIRSGLKHFDIPQTTIKLVTKAFKRLFDEEPELRCCTRIVIENQFKTKMRYLQYITATCLQTLMPHATVEHVSILKLKRHFGLECNGHYQNKKDAVSFVRLKERELLVGQLHDLNDNRADAILLLNYSVQENKLEFMTYGECPTCGNELIRRVCGQGNNSGKAFVNCPNGRRAEGDRAANKCNSTFFWLDENDKIVPPAPRTGQKRRNVPSVEEQAAKKQKLDDLEELVKQNAEDIAKLHAQLHLMEVHMAELEDRTQKLENGV